MSECVFSYAILLTTVGLEKRQNLHLTKQRTSKTSNDYRFVNIRGSNFGWAYSGVRIRMREITAVAGFV